MPTDFKRTDRIAEVMQRELAYIIQHNMKDPRFSGFVTISAVEVTRDLAHAKVYFTVYNADPATTLSLLTGSAGFLRTALSKTMTLRIVPQLHFIYDQSIEYGQRLNQLIDSVLPPESNDDANEE